MLNKNLKIGLIVLGIICMLTATGSIAAYFLYFLPQQEQAKLEILRQENEQKAKEKAQEEEVERNKALTSYREECVKRIEEKRDKAEKELSSYCNPNEIPLSSMQGCISSIKGIAKYNSDTELNLFWAATNKESWYDQCAKQKYDQIYGQ